MPRRASWGESDVLPALLTEGDTLDLDAYTVYQTLIVGQVNGNNKLNPFRHLVLLAYLKNGG